MSARRWSRRSERGRGWAAALFLGLLLLASGCGARPPAEQPPSAPVHQAAGPAPAQPAPETPILPPELQPTGPPHPRKDPVPLSPLSTLTTRHWTGDALLFRLAMVRALTDEANPLKLTPAEQERLQPHLRTILDEQMKIWFRCENIHAALGERWMMHEDIDHLHDHKIHVGVPEDNFADVYPVAAKLLARQAGDTRAAPADFDSWTPPEPDNWPDMRNDEDEAPSAAGDNEPEDDDGQRVYKTQPIEDLAYMLSVVAPRLEPREAAVALAELDQVEVSVERIRPAWMGVTELATRGGRAEYVRDLAARLKGPEKPYRIYRPAYDYLQRATPGP